MNTAFERSRQKDEWLTPRFILDALGPFDIDPCASIVRPWPVAAVHFTIRDDGLLKEWRGGERSFVFCNPPYGTQTRRWMRRMAEHNNGIALTFARTETRMFFESVWPKASAVYFLKGRLSFCDTSGRTCGPAGAPSVLIGYGAEANWRLSLCRLNGCFVKLR
jgi:hypothetical protein